MTAATIDETAVPVTASTQFEIHRNDWFDIIDDVLPFACSDDYMPTICCVQVRVSKSGLITAVATDRFTIGRHIFELRDHAGEAVEILLPLPEIKALRRIHAAVPRGTPNPLTVAITTKGHVTKEEAKDGKLSGVPGSITVTSRKGTVTSTHPGLDAEYVDASAFLPDEMKTGAVDRIAWNPEYMARFAKVKGARPDNTVVRFESPSRPIRIDIAERFSGCIMPVRLT